MSTPSRLAIFVACLGVVFVGSFAIGAALDVDDDERPVPATTVVAHDPHSGHEGSAPTTP